MEYTSRENNFFCCQDGILKACRVHEHSICIFAGIEEDLRRLSVGIHCNLRVRVRNSLTQIGCLRRRACRVFWLDLICHPGAPAGESTTTEPLWKEWQPNRFHGDSK